MKVTINTTAPQSREIDWSKPMVVTDGKEYTVLTDGRHLDILFSGMDVVNQRYSDRWNKKAFTPCTTPVTITFENEL